MKEIFLRKISLKEGLNSIDWREEQKAANAELKKIGKAVNSGEPTAFYGNDFVYLQFTVRAQASGVHSHSAAEEDDSDT